MYRRNQPTFRVTGASTLFLAAALLDATPALADDLPSRAPGLWEQKTVGADVISTIRQCVGAGADPLAPPAGACSKREVTNAENGVRLETVCARGGVETRSSTLITGDFSSSLRLQTVETVVGPGAKRVERRVAVDARRIGDCEPGQAPGDLILPNGRVIRAPAKG